VTRRSRLPLLAALAALALPASAQARVATDAPAPAHAARHCANANLVPAPGNLAKVRAAVLCLHNKVRVAHGLRPLRANRRLARAAAGHSTDMVAAGYFEHTAPSGSTMVARIMHSGYIPAGRGWTAGENLEWGTGNLGTPRGAMNAWMHSPGHRANILHGEFREMGVGITLGTPEDPRAAGTTYTVDFGAVR
jgi:uncharacterized protein YkwD